MLKNYKCIHEYLGPYVRISQDSASGTCVHDYKFKDKCLWIFSPKQQFFFNILLFKTSTNMEPGYCLLCCEILYFGEWISMQFKFLEISFLHCLVAGKNLRKEKKFGNFQLFWVMVFPFSFFIGLKASPKDFIFHISNSYFIFLFPFCN